MKRKLKWLPGGVLLILLVLQFTNPARTNPPVTPGRDLFATNPPPPHIAKILRAACYDCHSHETVWPGYSRVAPVSWLVVKHVNDGRERLNFSEWPHGDADRARSRWRRIRDEVESGVMPPKDYLLLHPEARLSDADRQALAEWADGENKRLQALESASE